MGWANQLPEITALNEWLKDLIDWTELKAGFVEGKDKVRLMTA